MIFEWAFRVVLGTGCVTCISACHVLAGYSGVAAKDASTPSRDLGVEPDRGAATCSFSSVPAFRTPTLVSSSGYHDGPSLSSDGTRLYVTVGGRVRFAALKAGVLELFDALPMTAFGNLLGVAAFSVVTVRTTQGSRTLAYWAAKAPASSTRDVYWAAATETPTGVELSPPLSRIPLVNDDTAEDVDPHVASDGTLYFSSNRGCKGGQDLYVARYVDGKYEPPVCLTLSTAGDDANPSVTADQRTIVFNTYNPATQSHDIHFATRPGIEKEFGPAQPFGNDINTGDTETEALIFPDGCRLLFGRGSVPALCSAQVLP